MDLVVRRARRRTLLVGVGIVFVLVGTGAGFGISGATQSSLSAAEVMQRCDQMVPLTGNGPLTQQVQIFGDQGVELVIQGGRSAFCLETAGIGLSGTDLQVRHFAKTVTVVYSVIGSGLFSLAHVRAGVTQVSVSPPGGQVRSLGSGYYVIYIPGDYNTAISLAGTRQFNAGLVIGTNGAGHVAGFDPIHLCPAQIDVNGNTCSRP